MGQQGQEVPSLRFVALVPFLSGFQKLTQRRALDRDRPWRGQQL